MRCLRGIKKDGTPRLLLHPFGLAVRGKALLGFLIFIYFILPSLPLLTLTLSLSLFLSHSLTVYISYFAVAAATLLGRVHAVVLKLNSFYLLLRLGTPASLAGGNYR